MTAFSIHTTVNQPVEIVEKALLNADNHPYWTTDLERLETIKGSPDEAGSVAHLHYRQKGRTYIMEDKLLFVEKGRKYISEVSGPHVSARVTTLLEPQDRDTVIRLSWDGKAKRFPLTLMLPLMQRKIKKLAAKDLSKFKELVETKGVDFSK